MPYLTSITCRVIFWIVITHTIITHEKRYVLTIQDVTEDKELFRMDIDNYIQKFTRGK